MRGDSILGPSDLVAEAASSTATHAATYTSLLNVDVMSSVVLFPISCTAKIGSLMLHSQSEPRGRLCPFNTLRASIVSRKLS